MAAGLYVHLPFCERRCGYCDFYVETGKRSLLDRTVDAILREAGREAAAWADRPFDSLFLGGGTPSLLGPERLARLVPGLRASLRFLEGSEVTVEANPESATAELLGALRRAGVDRLSLGVQSFADEDLRTLDRLHDASRARQALSDAREAGFSHLSLDLIYGLPGSGGIAAWQRTLRQAIEIGPDHISCYLLTLEETTPMGRRAARGEISLAGDGPARASYDLARRLLAEAGYEQYEISNWARPGHACRHNLNVWRGGIYLGLGPGAHGYDGAARRANRPDLSGYLAAIESGAAPPREEEPIDRWLRFEERLLLGLRLHEGVSWEEVARLGGDAAAASLRRAAAPFRRRGLLAEDDARLRIAEGGWFVSSALIGELIAGVEQAGACRAHP